MVASGVPPIGTVRRRAGPMTFESFAERIVASVGSPDLVVHTDTTFRDAGIDSLQRAELWLVCEELGMDLPEELFETLATFGDLFYYYETKTGADTDAGRP